MCRRREHPHVPIAGGESTARASLAVIMALASGVRVGCGGRRAPDRVVVSAPAAFRLRARRRGALPAPDGTTFNDRHHPRLDAVDRLPQVAASARLYQLLAYDGDQLTAASTEQDLDAANDSVPGYHGPRQVNVLTVTGIGQSAARHQPDHRARGPTARLRHPGLRRRPRAEIPSLSAGRRPASTPSSWPKTRTRQCGSSSTRRDGLCSGPVFAKAYFAYATDSAVSCRRAVALDISNSSPKDRAAGEAHVNSEHFAHVSVVLSEPLAAVPEIINVEVPDGWSQVSERPADSPDSPDS